MKLRWSIFFCFILLAQSTLGQSIPVIKIASLDYEPYFGNNIQGVNSIESRVNRFFKENGITIRIEYMPWRRAYEDAKMGKYDIVMGMIHRKPRAKYFTYGPLLLTNEFVLIKHKENNHLNVESIRNHTLSIGVTNGYALPAELMNNKNLKVYQDDGTLIKMLNSKRLDLIYMDKKRFLWILRKMALNADDFKQLENFVQLEELFISVSKKSKYYGLIQSALGKMYFKI